MAYFRPSDERERVSKRFLTAREVEDMAASGVEEIVHVDGLVITDAARETADDLGLRIRQPQRPADQDDRSSERSSQPAQLRRADNAVPLATSRRDASQRLGVSPSISTVQSISTLPRSRGAPADPLLQTLVQAVRSNRAKLSALAEGN